MNCGDFALRCVFYIPQPNQVRDVAAAAGEEVFSCVIRFTSRQVMKAKNASALKLR